jgi:hypothetical protein
MVGTNNALPATPVVDPAPQRSRPSFRPWWPWLLTALALPPAGYLAHGIVGRVDSVPSALFAGVIAGAVIGAAQWALLRRREITLTWIGATAAGLGVGLAAGAALVSYRTDRPALAVMGAVSGLAVGFAQAITNRTAHRVVLWVGATAALYALGWTVTDIVIADYVEEQWAVFGISGALTVAFVQSMIVGTCFPVAVRAKYPWLETPTSCSAPAPRAEHWDVRSSVEECPFAW